MSETKIPKIIHYCWLSGDKMTADTVKCMNSWKKHMPDYKLVLWDMNRFDVNSHQFVKEACMAKKWAFASDYIRLYALHTEGGIYMDTDVFVKKSFDDFLDNDFFTAVEYHKHLVKNGAQLLNKDGSLKDGYDGEIFTHGIYLQAAIMGSKKGHPFLKDCMDWYEDKHFILESGSHSNKKQIAPAIYAHVAQKYGFRYKNELQKLKCDMTIYPNTIFAGNMTQSGKDTYAVHRCVGTWCGKRYRIKQKLRENNFLRRIFGKKKIEDIL